FDALDQLFKVAPCHQGKHPGQMVERLGRNVGGFYFFHIVLLNVASWRVDSGWWKDFPIKRGHNSGVFKNGSGDLRLKSPAVTPVLEDHYLLPTRGESHICE